MKPNTRCTLALITMLISISTMSATPPGAEPIGILTLCNNNSTMSNGYAKGASYVYVSLYQDGVAEWKDRDVVNGDCDSSGKYGGWWQKEYSINGYLLTGALTIELEGPKGPGITEGTGTIRFPPSTDYWSLIYYEHGEAGSLHVKWAGGNARWKKRGNGLGGGATTYVIDRSNYAGKS